MRIPFISVEIPPRKLDVPLDAARAGLEFLTRNPGELLYALRHAANLRVVVPLDALRWLLGRLPAGKGPRDVVVGTRPPALTLAATVDIMGNAVDVETDVVVEQLEVGPETLRLALRLSAFDLRSQDPRSPIAQFLSSPSLDKTRPANLASLMPRRPRVLVEAKDDRLVLDFMKLKALADNPVARRILAFLAPVVSFPQVFTEDEHLVVAWRPRMAGLKDALASLRS